MKRNVLVHRRANYHYTRSPLAVLMETGMTSADAEFLLQQISSRDEPVKVEMKFIDTAHVARVHAALITHNIEIVLTETIGYR
jgi:hypothetical protein